MSGVIAQTLRHYDDIGLLTPARIAANGYRQYDREQLLRLQQILLLRELDMDLSAIAAVVDGAQDQLEALRARRQRLLAEVIASTSWLTRWPRRSPIWRKELSCFLRRCSPDSGSPATRLPRMISRHQRAHPSLGQNRLDLIERQPMTIGRVAGDHTPMFGVNQPVRATAARC